MEEQKYEEVKAPELPKAKEYPKVSLPDEPTKEDEGSLEIIFRMPVSGERVQRRYLKSDTVKELYHFIDHLQSQKKCTFEGVDGYCDQYRIIQSMPRKIFVDREASLESVGFYPRGAMLQIQQIEDEESD